MAYARLGADSQVYVFSDGHQLHCCLCRLSEHGEFVASEYPAMIAHLGEHERQGHRVPAYALEELRREEAISPSVKRVSGLEDEGLIDTLWCRRGATEGGQSEKT